MTKLIALLSISAFAGIVVLSGCNKASDAALKIEAPASPTTPDKPDAPQGVATVAPSATSAPEAPVHAADASASGTEARAGDVSVKLPN